MIRIRPPDFTIDRFERERRTKGVIAFVALSLFAAGLMAVALWWS